MSKYVKIISKFDKTIYNLERRKYIYTQHASPCSYIIDGESYVYVRYADEDLAASTLQHGGTRKLLGTDNQVITPPAPTSDPPVGPGLVVTPPPTM
jgi:hypothetical protein